MPRKQRSRKPAAEATEKSPTLANNTSDFTSEIDSTSSPGRTSLSSSDESKSEREPVQKEKKRKFTHSKKGSKPAGEFQTYLWVTLLLAFWILDIGVHLIRIIFPLELSSFPITTVVDWMRILYSFVVPLCFYKLWESSPGKVASTGMVPILIILTLSSCMQAVAETLVGRLQALGFDSNRPVVENAIMQFVKPTQLVDVFEILMTLSRAGFNLWWISFLLTILLYFIGCFIKKSAKLSEGIQQLGQTSFAILPLFGAYIWYLVCQYQIITPFILALLIMLVYQLFEQSLYRITDENGQFLLQSMGIAVVFLVTWKWLLWKDKVLGEMYPGVFGVAQPWTYVRLYIHNDIGHLRDVISDDLIEKSIPEETLSITVPTSHQ